MTTHDFIHEIVNQLPLEGVSTIAIPLFDVGACMWVVIQSACQLPPELISTELETEVVVVDPNPSDLVV